VRATEKGRHHFAQVFGPDRCGLETCCVCRGGGGEVRPGRATAEGGAAGGTGGGGGGGGGGGKGEGVLRCTDCCVLQCTLAACSTRAALTSRVEWRLFTRRPVPCARLTLSPATKRQMRKAGATSRVFWWPCRKGGGRGEAGGRLSCSCSSAGRAAAEQQQSVRVASCQRVCTRDV